MTCKYISRLRTINCKLACGHKWNASFSSRNKGIKRCPVCFPEITIPGVNTIDHLYPNIAKMYSSNNKLKASEILYTSASYAKWICPKCGGEYSARVRKVIKGTAKCPYCNEKNLFQVLILL